MARQPGLSPETQYNALIKSGQLQPDKGQEQALAALQGLFENIQGQGVLSAGSAGFARRLFSRRPISDITPQGLYLYGGVGRGKTMLMDLFAASVNPGLIQRVHFHDFMVAAQDAVQRARLKGAADPMNEAADQLIAKGPVICFDEMEVRDIADAMIIKRLFDQLWARGMVLVTTSNRAPDDLYMNGLHRDRFLPFIDALKAHNQIHHIAEGADWRAAVLQSISSWHVKPPHSQPDACRDLDRHLDNAFGRLSDQQPAAPQTIMVAGRALRLEKVAGDLVDTDFDSLCRQPLAARDYLVLADKFAGLLMRDIPVMAESEQNEARRFMWLVDAFYDRGRFLIASAQAPPAQIYTGSQWEFEFQRTCSRLQEMAHYRGMT